MKIKTNSIIIAFLIATGLFSCSTDEQKMEKSAAPKKLPLVNTQLVSQQNITSVINIVGTVKPNISGTIKAPANGIIEQLMVYENEKVAKGQIIAMLNPTERISLIAKNEQQVLTLTNKMNKPENATDSLQQLLNKAKADLELSYNMFQRIPITAELSGIVSERWIDIGSEVSEKDKLLEIYKPSSLVIKAEVNEKYFSVIKKGKKLPVQLNAYPGQEFTGTISLVYPKIDPTTRTVKFDITFNSRANIIEGMMAEIPLATEDHQNALCVPNDALLAGINNESFIYMVDADSVAHKIFVVPGISSKGVTEIVSGIKQGQKVVVKGQEMLKDGKKVKIAGTSKNLKK